MKYLAVVLGLSAAIGVCGAMGACTHPSSTPPDTAAVKPEIQQKSAASELPQTLRERMNAVGKIDSNCTAFHIGGGLVITAASCLLGDLESYESCRAVACKQQPGAAFCADKGGKTVSRPSPQNHGQNDAAMEEVHYQSNIPTECYVRRCRAELAHDQAAALSNGAATTGRVGPDELPPTTIQWAHGSSVCQAIVAASYAPGKLDYAVLIVENPPSVKLELDYEFVPRQAAQVDYLGYRVDQENGRLMLLKSMSIIEPEDRDAGSAELFCYAYDDKVLYRGSPLIDPVSSLVVGVHGIGGIDLCEQSSATLIKALKQTLAVFPESGLPEDPAE